MLAYMLRSIIDTRWTIFHFLINRMYLRSEIRAFVDYCFQGMTARKSFCQFICVDIYLKIFITVGVAVMGGKK